MSAANQNQENDMTTDYKKYSLEKLGEWMHDAISAAEATPQEIYDTIKEVVQESYYHHKHHASRADELLALLNGHKSITFNLSDIPDYTDMSQYNFKYTPSVPYNMDAKGNLVPSSCSNDDSSPECKVAWSDFWGCDKESTEEGKELCKEYSVREQEYCGDKSSPDLTYDDMTSLGYEMTADGFWTTKGNVKKWIVSVQPYLTNTDYFATLPDDLLNEMKWENGDQIEYVNNNDGSFTMRKVNNVKQTNS